MNLEHKDAQLVTAIVQLLAKHPDSVEVTRTIDDLGVLLTLRVHAEDMAGIVGREGRTAKAIRTLLRVIGAQNDERVNLKIVEPFGAEDRAAVSEPTVSDRESSIKTDNTKTDEYAVQKEASTTPAADAPNTLYSADSQTTSDFFNFDDIPEPLA